MAYVIAIDPGSTSGIVVFNPITRDISMKELFQAPGSDYDKKIKWLADAFADCLAEYEEEDIEMIAIETFVMRGKGGQQLQKLIGGYISRIPNDIPVRHVFNTTVKKLVGGKGSDDKEKVAAGVAEFFKINSQSKWIIDGIIRNQQWDLTDAFAIGIAGWMELCAEK